MSSLGVTLFDCLTSEVWAQCLKYQLCCTPASSLLETAMASVWLLLDPTCFSPYLLCSLRPTMTVMPKTAIVIRKSINNSINLIPRRQVILLLIKWWLTSVCGIHVLLLSPRLHSEPVMPWAMLSGTCSLRYSIRRLLKQSPVCALSSTTPQNSVKWGRHFICTWESWVPL